jgi:D-glycero-beta-D-manno-heptose-7-phosphate kinase
MSVAKLTLPDCKNARVLVVGDVMLDRYWFGNVERISPEAPVPIVHVQRTEERPGGAANVARNVAALGGQATLLSVVGDDEAGRSLLALLEKEHVKTIFHQDAQLPTTVKLRVIGRQQQLMRIDFETPPSREVLEDKLDDFESLVDSVDVVILSDYGKGSLT